FPSVRERLWANFEAVRKRTPGEVAGVLRWAMPPAARLVRVHTAGDFFNQDYFDGWLLFVRLYPRTRFWAFTKSLPYSVARLGAITDNHVLTATYGGRYDRLIEEHGLKSARVVYSPEEADALGLRLDRDDRMAAFGRSSFALLENFGSHAPEPEPEH